MADYPLSKVQKMEWNVHACSWNLWSSRCLLTKQLVLIPVDHVMDCLSWTGRSSGAVSIMVPAILMHIHVGDTGSIKAITGTQHQPMLSNAIGRRCHHQPGSNSGKPSMQSELKPPLHSGQRPRYRQAGPGTRGPQLRQGGLRALLAGRCLSAPWCTQTIRRDRAPPACQPGIPSCVAFTHFSRSTHLNFRIYACTRGCLKSQQVLGH